MKECDVVICGGGIAGLTLAYALGRQGRSVIVVEKQCSEVKLHKGDVLQPRSLEIFERLDLLAEVRKIGYIEANRLGCLDFNGTELVELDYRSLESSFNFVLMHYYHETLRAITSKLEGNVRVIRGARVTRLLRNAADVVTGVAVTGSSDGEISALLTVAADGPASVCRRFAGLTRGPVSRYNHDLLSFDLEQQIDFPPKILAYLSSRGLRLIYPMPHGRTRLYVQIQPGEAREIRRGNLEEWTRSLCSGTPALTSFTDSIVEAFPSSQSLPSQRWIAPAWQVPGLILIGDAAHCMHPIAGQGMNAAIRDAWELSESLKSLDNLIGSSAVSACLAKYERVRRPSLVRLSRLSHQLTSLFTSTSPVAQTLGRRLLASNSNNRRIRHILVYNMSGIGQHSYTFLDHLYRLGILRDPRRDQEILT